MSDEEVRRMIEDATKEAMTQSFTEAGKKYIQAAEACEERVILRRLRIYTNRLETTCKRIAENIG